MKGAQWLIIVPFCFGVVVTTLGFTVIPFLFRHIHIFIK